VAGLVAYVALELGGGGNALAWLCVDCWVDSVDDPGVVAAVTAAGTSVGTKALKDYVTKTVGKGPIFKYKDMYDIASQDTPEKQAEVAWQKYKSFIMTEHAPEGSPGDEINDAIDRFFDFHKDGIDLGESGDDDP
jgi:hypothetical protein